MTFELQPETIAALEAENARLRAGIREAIDELDTRSSETVDVIEMLRRLLA